MKRPVATLALAALLFAAAPLTAEEPPHLEFVRGLRDKHYFDLAREYLEKQIPKATPDQKAALVLELARTKLAMAAGEPAIEKRLVQYREARAEFENFLKNYGTSPLASEAKLDLAGVALEQGKTQLNVGLRQPTPVARASELLKARALLVDAGKQLAPTAKQLEDELKAKEEPKNVTEKAERKRLEQAALQAQYDLALNYFDIGQTYSLDMADANNRNEAYKQAQALLEKVAGSKDNYPIGWKAYAWLGRCDQETGVLPAGYRKLSNVLSEKGPEVEPGKRLAYYFMMLLLKEGGNTVSKDPNGESIKAGEEWLRRYGSSANSPEGYGVRFELAEQYLVQWGAAKTAATKKAVLDKALKQYKALEETESEYADAARDKKISIIFERINPEKTRLPIESLPNFDDCYVRAQYEFVQMNKEIEKAPDKAEDIRKAHFKNVITALQQAQKLAARATGAAKPSEAELNSVKALLAYTYLSTGKYDEARKTGEELGLAKVPTSQGAKAAMYALEAYDGLEFEKNKLEKQDTLSKEEQTRLDELKTLLDKENRVGKLAEHMEKLWPNDPAGNMARHKLALALIRKNDYVKAIEKLGQIKPDYPLYIRSQYQLAMAAREAEKTNIRPPAGQPPFTQVEITALQSMPNPTPDTDSYTFQLFMYGKLRLANFLLQEKKYKEVIDLVESLEPRLANVKGLEANVLEELKLALAELKRSAELNLAEVSYKAGKFAEVIALLAPVVEKVKAGELPEFKKNGGLKLALFSLVMRSYVQDGKPEKAQEILKLLLESAGEGEGLGAGDPMKALFGFAGVLSKQIDDLRKQGPNAKAQLDKTVANFAAFLDILAKQEKLPREYILFLAQSYGGLGMHDKAADLLKKLVEPKIEPGKENESQKPLQYYRGGRILLARELRLAKKFKEAKVILDDIEKQPWGKGLQLQKEKNMLLEDQEVYAGQTGAILSWNAMMHQLRPQITKSPEAKEMYYEAYFHMIYSYYKNALKMTDPAKQKQYIQKAAGYVNGLETDKPDMGGADSKKRFDDLINSAEGAPLKQELDLLRKGNKQ